MIVPDLKRDGVINSEASFSISNLTPGEHHITFEVKDNDGYIDNVSAGGWSWNNVSINARPSASIISIPSQILFSEIAYFQGSASDVDGTILWVTWYSDVDGQFGSDYNASSVLLSPGEHVITFIATDNDFGESFAAIANIEVIKKPSSNDEYDDDSSAPSLIVTLVVLTSTVIFSKRHS